MKTSKSKQYDRWTIEGTAFGTGPQSQQTIASYQGDVKANGRGFVNSHDTRGKAGDTATGKMTSNPFKIQHRYITLLVGGGHHKGKTCVNLVVDGNAVRTQTGFASNEMRPVQFDCTDLIGQQATIEIVDNHTGGWGNIGVDHIVFTNRLLSGRPVQQVAIERGLNPARLSRWIALLKSAAVQSVSHPLHLWQRFQDAPDDKPLDLAPIARSVLSAASSPTDEDASHVQIADFSDGLPTGWTVSGHAMDQAVPAKVSWDWGKGTTAVADRSSFSSGRISRRLNGVLRSPTFTLDHDNIHILARGENIESRLIIDGYYMFDFNGLLFGGARLNINAPDAPRWFTHGGDVRRYRGHKAYIEITDRASGWLEIGKVCVSNQRAPALQPCDCTVAISNQASKITSHKELAAAYSELINHESTRRELLSPLTGQDLLHYDTHDVGELEALRQQIVDIDKAIPQPTRVLGLVDGTPENEFIFVRGNHRMLGDEAPRQLLEALVGNDNVPTNSSGRLRFAQQIASPSNPLTARVIVNRLWHHLFGRGIVASCDNFGVLGHAPSHPRIARPPCWAANRKPVVSETND